MGSESFYFSLVATLVLVSGVGLFAAHKVKTAADFSVGGRKSGSSLVAGTIIGTIIGGAATIGTAQLAFTVGIAAAWFTVGAGLACLVLALFYARPFQMSGLQTIPQFLVMNYGPLAGPLTGITASIGIFFSLVANILSATPLMSALLGFGPLQAAGIVFLIILAYVFFGGVWGTGLVGIVKSVLIYVMLLAVGWVSYHEMGGFAGFTGAFPLHPWFEPFGRGLWVDLGGALSLLVGTLSTQTYIQAVYAAQDVRAARQGAVIAAFLTMPCGIPGVMVGMYMRMHFPDIAPIDALPLFILQYLPPWLAGISIAALLLAAIGSAAGLALGIGTMLSGDIILKLIKQKNDQTILWLNRSTVLTITLLATLFTLGNIKSLILDWNYLSMGLRGAGVFLPLSVAVFWPGHVGNQAALASMVAGAGTAVAWKLLFPTGLDPLFAGLAMSGLCLIVGAIAGHRRRAT